MEDAGLTQTDVTRLRASKDRDDGRTIYEVQFANENTEYDYEVEASNGEIMKVDMEETRQKNSQAQTDQTQTDQTQQGQSDQNNNGQNNGGQSSAQANVQVAQEEAVKLALDRVPGSTEQDLRIELEYDDGYYKYEGDIIYNQIEYEFEIDANTGAFLEWSEERR